MTAVSIRGIVRPILGEILIRVLLFTIFVQMERMPAFVRYASASSLESDYKHPRRDSTVTPLVLWCTVVLAPTIMCLFALFVGQVQDASQSILAVTLAVGINGVITNSVKLIAGRLRPDFFYRCFPDGVMTTDLTCTGDSNTVMEGRKSFPSGHSSFAFCSLGYISMWLLSRLGVCGAAGRRPGGALRTVVSVLPLYVAALVAISRTCDYHHHWEDVFVGSTLGLATAYACYRQRYPPPWSPHAGVPYCALEDAPSTAAQKSDSSEMRLLDNGEENGSKWM